MSSPSDSVDVTGTGIVVLFVTLVNTVRCQSRLFSIRAPPRSILGQPSCPRNSSSAQRHLSLDKLVFVDELASDDVGTSYWIDGDRRSPAERSRGVIRRLRPMPTADQGFALKRSSEGHRGAKDGRFRSTPVKPSCLCVRSTWSQIIILDHR